jgi:hypothetical protein
MLPDGALFTEDKVPIPVVIGAYLRAMADWLLPKAQQIGGISCVGLALDGTSYLTRHSFEQIGERSPTVADLSHSAWQWDEQAVQGTNQRMEDLAINALLVQLYQPELLSSGPTAKVRSGKGFAGATWRTSKGGHPQIRSLRPSVGHARSAPCSPATERQDAAGHGADAPPRRRYRRGSRRGLASANGLQCGLTAAECCQAPGTLALHQGP